MERIENNIKASIVIPAFNAEDYLTDTLDSIIENTCNFPIEIIIVNDGSTDQTEQIAKTYPAHNIRCLTIDNSGGPSRPRNVGIANSTGEYIFIFDSDDIMLAEKIQRSIDAFEQCSDAEFLFTNFQSIDSNGAILNANFLSNYETLYNLESEEINSSLRKISGTEILKGLATANFIGTSSIVIRRSALESIGGFDEEVKNGDDFNLWVRLASHFPGLFLDIPLHQYRIHKNSISKSNHQRRLENLVELHIKNTKDEFPQFFREASRHKVSSYSLSIAKNALKSGDSKKSRHYIQIANNYGLSKIKTYPLTLLSYLPKSVVKLGYFWTQKIRQRS